MRRLWAAAAVIWLPVGVTAATWSMWNERLPSRIATHWGSSGPADRFSSTIAFWLFALVAGILAGLVGLAAASVASRMTSEPARRGDAGGGGPASGRRAGGDPARDVRVHSVMRGLLIGGGGVAGGAAGMWVATAGATLADAGDPRLGWRFAFFLLGLAWAGVIRLIAGRPPRLDVPVPPPADALDLGPTERAAFSTTLRSPLILTVMAVATAVLVVQAVMVQPGQWLVVPLPVIAALVLGQARLTADRRGLRLVAWLGGITFKRIPLDEIRTAEAMDINPVAWGGWGYRILPGSSALVLRAGPGLVLNLRDGRRFAVTLDDPRTPAALLNGLQARNSR